MVIHNRKHWREIVGLHEADIIKTLTQWRSDHTKYPHSWDLFSAAKLTQEARDIMARVLGECRDCGWYAPRVRDGVLFFSSIWPVERRASEGDWHSRWQQSQRQAGDDTEAEFVQERMI